MTDIWMDVDLSLAEVPVNLLPLVDDTDFKAIEAAILYNAAGMSLIWHFVTTAGVMTETAVIPTTAGLHDWVDQGASGLYALEVPNTGGTINNDTEGFGWFTGVVTGVLPWRGPIIGFRAPAINDALIDLNTLLTSKDLREYYESAISIATSNIQFDMSVAIDHDNVWIGEKCTIEQVSTGTLWPTWVTDVDKLNDRLITKATPNGTDSIPFTVIAGDIVRVGGGMHPLYALQTFAGPTRLEATADLNTILAKLLAYVSLMVRSDAAAATTYATELTAIAGTFDNTTDSLEALQVLGAAVKAKTDQLAFTIANEVDANTKSFNDANIVGDGSAASKWRDV